MDQMNKSLDVKKMSYKTLNLLKTLMGNQSVLDNIETADPSSQQISYNQT